MAKIALMIFLVFSVIGIVMLQFGFVFMLLALLPSLMAFFVDRTPGKPAFKSVLACNMAGVVPATPIVFQSGLSFKYHNISSVLGDPHIWLMAYSGAAIGWCLVYLCRFIARLLIIVNYEYRINSMERMQRKLVNEWGKDIAEKLSE